MSKLLEKAHGIINELMAAEGTTKSELAKRLGTSVSNVSQLLSNERNLTVKMFDKIVTALNHTPDLALAASQEETEDVE